MKKEPDDCDLLSIFKGYYNEYRIIGVGLGVSVADLPLYNPQMTTNYLIIVFQRWKAANNEVTWGKIAKVCDSFSEQLGRVHFNLLEYLSSQKAHEKYSQKPDRTK